MTEFASSENLKSADLSSAADRNMESAWISQSRRGDAGAFNRLGQAKRAPLDMTKSREELEIMKGILNTWLKFAAETRDLRTRISIANAFYLSGQGAVFVIPASLSRFQFGRHYDADPEFSQQMMEIRDYVRALQAESARLAHESSAVRSRSGIGSGIGAGIGGGAGNGSGGAVHVPPAPPAAPAPPAPFDPPTPAPPQPAGSSREQAVKQEQARLQKTAEELQARAKKLKEEAEAERRQMLGIIVNLEEQLVEALAKYGDSLNMLKPEEHINVVLVLDDIDERGGTKQDVISVQKSWITEYKAGRLSLQEFKQKAVQYRQ